MPPVLAAAAAGVVTALIEVWVFHSDTRFPLVGVGLLLLNGLIFAVCYLGVLAVLAPRTVRALLSAVWSRVAR